MELELINNQLLAKTPIETIIQDTTIKYTTTSQYGFSEVSPKYAIQREITRLREYGRRFKTEKTATSPKWRLKGKGSPERRVRTRS